MIIIRRAPRRRSRRAQKVAEKTQISAEIEKDSATSQSATCSSRPIAGSTDCRQVVPVEVTMTAPNSTACWREVRLGRGAGGTERPFVLGGAVRRG